LIGIFDNFILTLLGLGCRLGFGEVNFFSFHFHFDISRASVAAFVIGACDVARRTWERQGPTFRAKHVQGIAMLHLIIMVALAAWFYFLKRIYN